MLDNVGSGTYVRQPREHVFVWSQATDLADRAFFAGFVAGDGSFSIKPNNAGASWCCCLQVKLRADDTPLLTAMRSWSGAGQLSPASARGGSHPQTAWMIGRQAECLKVAAILDSSPLIGKKAREFQIWREAVELWVTYGGAAPELDRLAAALRALRDQSTPAPYGVSISHDYLAAFLAGFASAEAHFGASDTGSPSFTINLRADDGPLLRLFHERFRLGHLADIPAAGRSRAAMSWRVGRLSELRRLTDLFDGYPPRGRAARVYAAWRELIRLEPRTGSVRHRLAAEVRRSRAFQPELANISKPTRLERRQSRCFDALHSWALTLQGPGSSTEYENWRRTIAPAAPSRNTVAAAFGSWRGALVAAEISCDRAQPPEMLAKVRRARSSARAAHRAKSRSLVLDAVTSCLADLGREPRATEFLRWRHQHAPGTPSQMTIYRLFPGGFKEVLVALRGRSVRQLRVQLDRLHGRQGLRYRAAFLRRLGVLLEVGVVDSGH
jgi:LAGLIDADG endonuclease